MLAVVLFLYAVVATALDRLSITGPLIVMVAGAVVGPGGLGLLHGEINASALRILASLALAVILFHDASTISVFSARNQASVATRLLTIGLVLTIGAGALVAHLCFPSAPWALCGVLGALLAPTDAALGLAVVTNRAVPSGVRNALNIESGLNDGLATPFVYFFLALALSEGTSGHWERALVELVGGIGVGVLSGLVVGALCRTSKDKGWINSEASQFAVLVGGLLCYVLALRCEVNGFVAVYVAGFTFSIGSDAELVDDLELTDSAGIYASYAVWALFGAFLVGPVLRGATSWIAILYALVSLTLVRMVPVALALLGTGFRRSTTAFMGWFGPRGLASVVFTIVVVDALGETSHFHPLLEAATWTIVLSVVLHGLSAGPLASRYGSTFDEHDSSAPEVALGEEPRGNAAGGPPCPQ